MCDRGRHEPDVILSARLCDNWRSVIPSKGMIRQSYCGEKRRRLSSRAWLGGGRGEGSPAMVHNCLSHSATTRYSPQITNVLPPEIPRPSRPPAPARDDKTFGSRQKWRFAVVLAVLLSFAGCATVPNTPSRRTVTLLHFSDYHSHAVPFYSEGETNTAGIARAIGYLRPFADRDDTLIFSGGDMINKGSPSWSDRYRCAEWSWLNGIVDAMAFGNHDADYGPAVFADCRSSITWPILGGNIFDAGGAPLFLHEGKPYAVFERNGARIGVFAVAGDDFRQLVRPAISPADSVTFSDAIETARTIVSQLREIEDVDAIVMIGHQQREEDLALARAVPGIDLIFGTHSHRKSELEQISGTNTWTISPFQYLTYISRVEMAFDCDESDCRLAGIDGGLVAMNPRIAEDADIAARVKAMKAELESDPQYAAMFRPIGTLRRGLTTDGQLEANSPLGSLVLEVMRSSVNAHAAFSTSSSFREPIAPGVILEETLRASLPYPNQILLYDLDASAIGELLRLSVARSGTDFFSQTAGIRYSLEDGAIRNIEIFRDSANPSAGFEPLQPGRTYRIAATDYQARVAPGYREFFSRYNPTESGKEVRDQVREWLKKN